LPEGHYPELQPGEETDHAGLGELLYDSGLDLLPIPAEFTEPANDDAPIGFA
jgi:hypothetical protein